MTTKSEKLKFLSESCHLLRSTDVLNVIIFFIKKYFATEKVYSYLHMTCKTVQINYDTLYRYRFALRKPCYFVRQSAVRNVITT